MACGPPWREWSRTDWFQYGRVASCFERRRGQRVSAVNRRIIRAHHAGATRTCMARSIRRPSCAALSSSVGVHEPIGHSLCLLRERDTQCCDGILCLPCGMALATDRGQNRFSDTGAPLPRRGGLWEASRHDLATGGGGLLCAQAQAFGASVVTGCLAGVCMWLLLNKNPIMNCILK